MTIFSFVYSTDMYDDIRFLYDPSVCVYLMLAKGKYKRKLLSILAHIIVGVLCGLFFLLLLSTNLVRNNYGSNKQKTKTYLAENGTPSDYVALNLTNMFKITLIAIIANIIHLGGFFWYNTALQSRQKIRPYIIFIIALFDFVLIFTTNCQQGSFSKAIASWIFTGNFTIAIVSFISGIVTCLCFSLFYILNKSAGLYFMTTNNSDSLLNRMSYRKNEYNSDEENDMFGSRNDEEY